MGDDGNTPKIVRMRTGEHDVLPSHINRKVDHLAQVEQQIDRAFETDLGMNCGLEFLEVRQRKLAIDVDDDAPVFLLDNDHDLLLASGLSVTLVAYLTSFPHGGTGARKPG